MKLIILVFYQDDKALDAYLAKFSDIVYPPVRRNKLSVVFDGPYYMVRCIRGIPENVRGMKAHVIAVQEDLTWQNEWSDRIRCILNTMLLTPIPVQIFDGQSYEDAVKHESVMYSPSESNAV